MTDNELPGMWETSDFTGGADEARPMRATGAELVRQADAAQYERPPIPTADVGRIKVRLLNATPDPLGSVAALIAQYSGVVIRDLAEVTDEMRRSAIDDMGKTVLNGPLEAVQFHWQIEGVTRSITHQMVRSRASFFAQESLRFAVPTGAWAEEIPLPPSLAGAREERTAALHAAMERGDVLSSKKLLMLDEWEDAMITLQNKYERLIELGMPAEEARGVLPHDMPTRIHWVCDLRTLLQEAGKRTCTQAQFPWRLIFGGIAQALRERASIREGRGYQRKRSVDGSSEVRVSDGWQFREIAARLRPVCFQTGSCGFMAQFDRSCTIRERVDRFAANGIEPSHWGTSGQWDVAGCEPGQDPGGVKPLLPIMDYEWAANPAAARS